MRSNLMYSGGMPSGWYDTLILLYNAFVFVVKLSPNVIG